MSYYKTTPTKLPELKARIEKIVGYIEEWCVEEKSVQFIAYDISLKTLQALSDELGTEEMNLNFGSNGEPGYSEYTPSTPGHAGYIEVLLANIKEASK